MQIANPYSLSCFQWAVWGSSLLCHFPFPASLLAALQRSRAKHTGLGSLAGTCSARGCRTQDRGPRRSASGNHCRCLTSAAALPPAGPSSHRPEGSVALALTSGFPGSIHGHLDGSVVGGHLGGVGEYGDGQCETLPWGRKVENKGGRLAPGAVNNTPFSLPEGADLSPLNPGG